MPIFSDSRQFLDEAYFREGADKTWVVPMLAGDANKNLGTPFCKITPRAGGDVWPKPFQNCRARRQTELNRHFATGAV